MIPSLDITQWSLVRQKMQGILDRQPHDEGGWYGTGYNVLIALRKLGGDRAKPLYREYLRRGGPQRYFSVCEALRQTKGEWDGDFLIPMLSDKRLSTGYTHPAKPNKEEPRLTIRVCDQAAEIIGSHRKDIKFQMVGTHEEIDRQINKIRKQLAGKQE